MAGAFGSAPSLLVGSRLGGTASDFSSSDILGEPFEGEGSSVADLERACSKCVRLAGGFGWVGSRENRLGGDQGVKGGNGRLGIGRRDFEAPTGAARLDGWFRRIRLGAGCSEHGLERDAPATAGLKPWHSGQGRIAVECRPITQPQWATLFLQKLVRAALVVDSIWRSAKLDRLPAWQLGMCSPTAEIELAWEIQQFRLCYLFLRGVNGHSTRLSQTP